MIKNILRKTYLFEYKAFKSLADFGDRVKFSNFYRKIQDMFSGRSTSISKAIYSEWLDLNNDIFGNLDLDLFEYYYGDLLLKINEDSFIIISNKQSSQSFKKKDINIISSTKIKSHKNIPELWFLNAHLPADENKEYISNNPYGDIPKYLFEKFEIKNIINFIQSNASKLDDLKNLWFKESPKFLGKGEDGIVFDIGDNKIIKIFSSRYSYDHVIKVMKRLTDNPEMSKTEAIIFDAGIFHMSSSVFKKPLYYYIMEKMKTTIQSIDDDSDKNLFRDLINEITDIIEREIDFDQMSLIRKSFNSPKSKNKILGIVKNLKDLINQIFNSTSTSKEKTKYLTDKYNLSEKWLENFIEEMIMKHFSSRTDLQNTNLGITNSGELRFFDPVYKKPD